MGLKDKISQFDLVGGQGPVSDMGTQTPAQFNYGPGSTLQQDSLISTYNSNIHNGVAYGPSELDINGQPGPQFANYRNSTYGIGPESPGNLVDTLHEQSLTQDYTYQHGTSTATIGATTLDLNGQQGPKFANYRNKAYNIGGEPSPNANDTIAEMSLTQDYGYQHGNASEVAKATTLDLDGQQGPKFANYRNSAYGIGPEPPTNLIDTLHEQSLTQDYSYQHGISTGLSTSTTLDLNGQTPSQYLDNLPG